MIHRKNWSDWSDWRIWRSLVHFFNFQPMEFQPMIFLEEEIYISFVNVNQSINTLYFQSIGSVYDIVLKWCLVWNQLSKLTVITRKLPYLPPVKR